jgi:hypothetical protein
MRRVPSHSLAALVVAIAIVGCAAADRDRPTAPPIATARAQGIGSQVMVDGVVTVAPGTFDDGFALQDASGGIYVARAQDHAIELGSRVRVWGTLAAPDQRITVEPTALQITGQASAPAPLEVATGGVGPATEGRLIAVRGRVAGAIVDDRPWGTKLYVNDGSGPLLVFIAAATSIDGTRYRAGQELRIVGFSGRFGDHTEVLPRGPSDIRAGPM